jgi:hypothetical protein
VGYWRENQGGNVDSVTGAFEKIRGNVDSVTGAFDKSPANFATIACQNAGIVDDEGRVI